MTSPAIDASESPVLALAEIAAAERALDNVMARADRIHASRIEHDTTRCVRCFIGRG